MRVGSPGSRGARKLLIYGVAGVFERHCWKLTVCKINRSNSSRCAGGARLNKPPQVRNGDGIKTHARIQRVALEINGAYRGKHNCTAREMHAGVGERVPPPPLLPPGGRCRSESNP